MTYTYTRLMKSRLPRQCTASSLGLLLSSNLLPSDRSNQKRVARVSSGMGVLLSTSFEGEYGPASPLGRTRARKEAPTTEQPRGRSGRTRVGIWWEEPAGADGTRQTRPRASIKGEEHGAREDT
ncbi:hypothetical protein CRG98_003014 [Punica granatum]|uniref:Uncharacterized protein n=1 Tax=Punica granatum TaxID=22663 RepID=A0A2I0L7N6_PUNGR|nr:hypothetical protein CRG98_003014 [Punica granatum]